MNNPKISIILSSIEPNVWPNLYNQIKKSVGEFTFEVVAVGPFFPPKEIENIGNFIFLRSFACPSVCLQMGASIARGEFITWLPSDCMVFENTLAESIRFLETKNKNDALTILYSEGINLSGSQHLDPIYWVARTHADLQLKWVKEGWKIAPIFMMNLEYFKELGGLDCAFEHINLNTHSLMFLLQSKDGVVYSSPNRVFASNWKPWGFPKGPIQLAYEENDAPLFKKMYDGDENPLTRKVDFDNWRNADSIWKRRFTV